MSTDRLLGSGKDDYPKTPTLRQVLKAGDRKVPLKNMVKIVFAPGKVPNWSFVTDTDFRVNVLEGTSLWSVLNESIHQLAQDDSALYVWVEEGSTGDFSIGIDDKQRYTWEQTNYGYKLKPDGFKSTRRSTKQHE